jgi:hypothetical protein
VIRGLAGSKVNTTVLLRMAICCCTATVELIHSTDVTALTLFPRCCVYFHFAPELVTLYYNLLLRKLSDWNRTCDLPVCSVVP